MSHRLAGFLAFVACSDAPPPVRLPAVAPSRPAALLPSGWIAIPVPRPGSTRHLECAAIADDQWQVALTADSSALEIMPATRRPLAAYGWDTPRDTLRLPDGRLSGTNRGEWGGEIWWEPTQGRRIRIAQENLVRFLRRDSTIFAFVGLAHLSHDEGRILQLGRPDGRWQVVRSWPLGSMPWGYTTLAGDTLLVPTDSLLLVHFAGGAPVLRALHGYSGLPQADVITAARDRAGVLYLGAQSGVVQLTPRPAGGYVERWIVRPECRTLKRLAGDAGCACSPESAPP